jgi:hypothetical protein
MTIDDPAVVAEGTAKLRAARPAFTPLRGG